MRTSPRLLLDSLKRCPLCEAVNGEASLSCVVCGWAGAFEHDADDLQASFQALVAQCPELTACVDLTERKGSAAGRKPGGWWNQAFRRFRAAF